MRPISAEFPDTQQFGSNATGGVVGDYNGTEVQVLVAMYGNYQEFGHAGKDIGCPVGTPVRAAKGGTVVWCDWDVNLPGGPNGYSQRWDFYQSFGGRIILLQHGQSEFTAYCHLSRIQVQYGQWVNEGDQIALSGDSSGGQDGVLGPHLHFEYLTDLSYSTGNGRIYGRENPDNLGGIAAMGTITQETDMPLTKEEVDWIAGRVAEVIQPMHDVTRTYIPAAVWDVPIPYRDPVTGAATEQTTTGKTAIGYNDFQHNATRASTPAAVLNQAFTLTDGTHANLAGILDQIHSRPAATAGPGSAAPTIDVEALVARLKAELPPAIRADIATKLVQP